MNYTIDEARREFKPLLKRAGVLEMAEKFGVTSTTVRKWIEGKEAVVKQSVVKGYWKRDDVLGQMFPAG